MQKVYLCLIVDAKKSGIWSILEVEMTSNATIQCARMMINEVKIEARLAKEKESG